MKAKLTLFAIFILLTGYLAAQSSVQIKDILVSPVMEVDTITNQTTPVDMSHPFLTDTTNSQISLNETYQVLFKIGGLEHASVIHLKIGTEQNLGNILDTQVQIIVIDNSYFVSYGGNNEEIIGDNVKIYLNLTEQEKEDFQFLTLNVEDNQGSLSNPLIFVK